MIEGDGHRVTALHRDGAVNMKNLLFIFPFLVTTLACGSGSPPAATTPRSGGSISVSPNSTLRHCIGAAPGQPPPQNISELRSYFSTPALTGLLTSTVPT
jgi:hypothetical protein